MRRVVNRNRSMQGGSNFQCDGGSSASAGPVAAVSCSAAGPCRPRAASHWFSRRPECTRLLRACAARGIRKEAIASWREYVLFLPARFFAEGNIVHRVAVAPFPRWRDAQSLRPIDIRKMARSKTRVTSRFLFGKSFHDFFRSDGNFINPHSDGIINGVGHGRHDRQERALTDFLRAKRAAGIRFLDQFSDHFGHVERGWTLVFQDRGELVHQCMRKFFRKAPELLLFHQRFAEPHVDAALDLAAHKRRIERAADVVRDPNLWNGDPASHWIYFDFDDGRGIRIGGRWPHTAALVQRGRLWRSVGAHRADRAEASFCQANSFLKSETFFRRGGVEYAFVSKAQPFFRYFQFFRYGFCNDCFSAFCGLQSCVSSHQCDAARIRSQVHRPEVRVTCEETDVERVDA